MQWGDELCGVKVTPEAWTHDGSGGWLGGGIIEFICPAWGSQVGAWEAVENGIAGYCRLYNSGDHLPPDFYDKLRRNYRPIFPPRGWAGKTDEELWAAVFGPSNPAPEVEPDFAGIDTLIVWFDGEWVDTADNGQRSAQEIPALILALQNAQVLADRLRGES